MTSGGGVPLFLFLMLFLVGERWGFQIEPTKSSASNACDSPGWNFMETKEKPRHLRQTRTWACRIFAAP